jgi:hypothetical protein
VRTKLTVSGGPEGVQETVLESAKPNRFHMQNDAMEAIVIGGKVYTKIGNNDWTTTNAQLPKQQFDPQEQMKTLMSSAKFQGKVLGRTMLNDVPTLLYEITEDDARLAEKESILIWIGEADQLPRKLKVSNRNSPMQFTFSFSDFNAVSIKAPF